MASTRMPLCSVCSSIPWFKLQPEDVFATPHHGSRKHLEASARRCTLCRMILKAAISNYKDTRGIRNGRGYWRQLTAVSYHDVDSSVRDVTYVKEFGACKLVTSSEYRAPNSMALPMFGPTGAINLEGDHIDEKDEKLASLDRLDHEPQDDMPVWVYGNIWADHEMKHSGDTSHLRMMGVGARFAKSRSHFDAFGVPTDQIKLCGSSVGLCTDDDSGFASFIPGRPRELRSDSDTAFDRIQNWVKQCSGSHLRCGAPSLNPDLPKRVIDVFVSDRKIALFETRGQRGRYVSLSHCWGTSSRLMATRESVEDLQEGLAISLLPKTFQDAIKITRKLGIKYLWIDCLCIIQDDPDDWEAEAANMPYIYKNAYVTISASASTDSYYGCFPKRAIDSYVSPATRSLGYDIPREAPGSISLAYKHSSNPGQLSRLYFFEEWLPGSSFHSPQRTSIGSFGKCFDPIASESLSSRGWTLQERILSPRIIHYATDQLYFECESGMESEDKFNFTDIFFSLKRLLTTQLIPPHEHGISSSGGISFIVGRNISQSGRRWEGGWISLVENYSHRKLTVEQDKLPAIAGLASVIIAETKDTYCAGLWAAHIYEDLCWRVYHREEYFNEDNSGKDTPKKGKVVGCVTRPKEYRAPSWSWASLDAPIKYIPLSYSKLNATVIGISTMPAREDDLSKVGRLKGGKIDIKAPIYEVRSHTPKKAWDRHGIPVSIDFEDDRGVCLGEIHADFPDEPLQFPCYAVFLDPANALIIRPNKPELQSYLHPYVDSTRKQVSDQIFTTSDANRNIRENPRIKEGVFKAIVNAVRVGLGVFTGGPDKPTRETGEVGEEEEKEPRKWDSAVDGELTLDKIWHVSGDDSWGPVKKEDKCVWVTIV